MQGMARQGKAMQGMARQGKARQGKARQGKARQGKARQGKARQGKGECLRDVQTLFPNAGGHQGIEGPGPEVSQHLLLLSLLHAHAHCLS